MTIPIAPRVRSAASTDPAVIWSPDYLSYRLSAEHPMNPARIALTMALTTELGLLDGVETLRPTVPSDGELMRIHSADYLAAVRDPVGKIEYGLGSDDNPVFEGMHESSALLVGGSLAGARAIAAGRTDKAVNIGGGMHHAMPGHAAGFCVYNDAAIAISWLLDNGFDRIAYIDVDVHHGDGVQRAFAHDPRVLTVSIHQHPATLWPNTGWPAEIGFGEAEGTAINIAVLPGTGDGPWLRAFHAVVPGAVRAFKPQIIVSQCGADSHREDPLADLALTVDAHKASYQAMRDLADEVADGRWLALGGGGYGLVQVVPRSWTHLIATVLGVDVPADTATPGDWRALAETTRAGLPPEMVAGVRVPTTMGETGPPEFTRWDGGRGTGGTDPGTDRAQRDLARIDSAIFDTRSNIYPLLGLDPEDPRD